MPCFQRCEEAEGVPLSLHISLLVSEGPAHVCSGVGRGVGRAAVVAMEAAHNMVVTCLAGRRSSCLPFTPKPRPLASTQEQLLHAQVMSNGNSSMQTAASSQYANTVLSMDGCISRRQRSRSQGNMHLRLSGRGFSVYIPHCKMLFLHSLLAERRSGPTLEENAGVQKGDSKAVLYCKPLGKGKCQLHHWKETARKVHNHICKDCYCRMVLEDHS